MRTKTLLLGAAVAAASLATSLAQSNVYSLNVVGYVNVTVPPSGTAGGFAIICNPLDRNNQDGGTNTLRQLIPTNAVGGLTAYQYNGVGYNIANYGPDDDDIWGWDNDLVLNPGEGLWLQNLVNTPVTLTMVGEVKQGNQTNQLASGFTLSSSIVPQSLPLWNPGAKNELDVFTNNTAHGINDMNFPAALGDTTIYLFKATGGYNICNYGVDDDGNPGWDSYPVPQVGEGFWVLRSEAIGAANWVRNFVVQ